MALKLLVDFLTGNLALVSVPQSVAPAGRPGQPIGLLLSLTYPD